MSSYGFGTLWWVDNVLWSEKSTFVDNHESKNHPGISLMNGQIHEYRTEIPMLFGTSNETKNCFIITGLTRGEGGSKEAKHRTYFGALRPCSFDFRHFFFGDITRNEPKTSLTAAEKEELKAYLRRKLA